jgi:dTDP-4-dehydrorhamnose 3,5-epimerase
MPILLYKINGTRFDEFVGRLTVQYTHVPRLNINLPVVSCLFKGEAESAMKTVPTILPDVLTIEPAVHGDDRGFFYESFNQKRWNEATGLNTVFVQDNHSRSARNVLRGLHYQIRHPQGKLVRVIVGEVFDVAVDLRRKSPTFGQGVGVTLSAENKRQIWIPEGYAHGFVVVSEVAEILYKATDYWRPEFERSILWNDPRLAIKWPIDGKPLLSGKDASGRPFEEAETFSD